MFSFPPNWRALTNLKFVELTRNDFDLNVLEYPSWERLALVLSEITTKSITRGPPFSIVNLTRKLNTLLLTADKFGVDLEGDKILDLSNLQRLSITVKSPKRPQKFPVCLTGLLHYSLQADWGQLSKESQKNLSECIIQHSPQLKTLELPGCPEDISFLLRYANLQALTITAEITEDQRKLLLQLQSAMPNLSVNYPNKPLQCLILELPEDCLVLILSYLSKEDMMTVRRVNRRFRKAFGVQAALTWKEGITIDEKFLYKYPVRSCMDIYKGIGRGAVYLNLTDPLPEDTVILLMQQFQRLKTLRLNITGLKNTKAIEDFPPLVEELHLTGHSKYLVNLYEHVRPTLKRLGCYTSGPYLNHIHNIEELSITCTFLLKDLNAFWDQNQGLRSLKIILLKDMTKDEGATIQENWKRIGELPKLKRLEFPSYYDSKLYHRGFAPNHLSRMVCLPALEVYKVDPHLRMVAGGEIIDKIGPSLKEFTGSWVSLVRLLRVKSLERLSLLDFEERNSRFYMSLTSILRELPNLKEFTAIRTPLRKIHTEELLSFLHGHNRTLIYNGTLLPCHANN